MNEIGFRIVCCLCNSPTVGVLSNKVQSFLSMR